MSEEQKSIKFYLLQFSAHGIKVNCMESVSAVTFRWPHNEDTLVYHEDVLCEIEPTMPVNQRGHYKPSEADFKQANEIIASRR